MSDLSRRMLVVESYLIEAGLILWSIWAAKVFWTPPSNFAAYQKSYYLIAEMCPSEMAWGYFVAIAAVLKIIGLVLCLIFRKPAIGMYFRQSGVAMSCGFWTLVGLSRILSNYDTLLGLPVFTIGLSAGWLLLRYPSMPRRR